MVGGYILDSVGGGLLHLPLFLLPPPLHSGAVSRPKPTATTAIVAVGPPTTLCVVLSSSACVQLPPAGFAKQWAEVLLCFLEVEWWQLGLH